MATVMGIVCNDPHSLMKMLMNVSRILMTVLTMLPALTLREVMSACVTLDSLEMDSTAQVRMI